MSLPETVLRRYTSDLLPIHESKPRPPFWKGRKLVCNYDYTSETGRVVFRKQRFSLDEEIWGRAKDFSILTPMPINEDPTRPTRFWSGGPEDQSDWLYRLPEVLGAHSVHWCEGEKDADALAKSGLVATSNAMGAAKMATSTQARWLREANRVTVWADKDLVGYWNAATRYNALIEVGLRPSQIRIALATHPEDKDAADHIARHGRLGVRGPRYLKPEKLGELASDYKPGSGRRYGY